jgi:hypothetical protein
MVIFAAFALSVALGEAAAARPEPVAAERPAVAMVRILPGASVRFAEIEKQAPERLTDARIRTADGASQPARLVEFH